MIAWLETSSHREMPGLSKTIVRVPRRKLFERSLIVQRQPSYKVKSAAPGLLSLPVLASSALGRSSSIRDLEISSCSFDELQDQFTQVQLEEMPLLLENDSKLQKLRIGGTNSPELVSALGRSIPKKKLEEFHFDLHKTCFM